MAKNIAKKTVKGTINTTKKVVNLYKPSVWRASGWPFRASLIIFTIIAINIALMLYWSSEPSSLLTKDVIKKYTTKNKVNSKKIGVALTSATIETLDVLLNKKGGYLSNDIMPPTVLMNNIPEWEFGVLRNLRDLSKIYRNNFSKSGSQAKENANLVNVENLLSIDSESWAFPSAEAEYGNAKEALEKYLAGIIDNKKQSSQFYARADNLKQYFSVVSVMLGSYSHNLSASIGTTIEDTSLAGDRNASKTTKTSKTSIEKTTWSKVDNNFYQARGYAWALLQQLKAIEIDFDKVLEDKNAKAYIRQLINELERTQQKVWSPIILNGNGFGFVTNHSLIMSSYLSRANSTIIDLVHLLENG